MIDFMYYVYNVHILCICNYHAFGIVTAVTKVKRKVVKLLKSKSCY